MKTIKEHGDTAILFDEETELYHIATPINGVKTTLCVGDIHRANEHFSFYIHGGGITPAAAPRQMLLF